MDPATGLAILGSAVGSAKVVEKILGPTAEYLGGGLKVWTEKRVENTKRIFQRAHYLLGDRINSTESVPPRVLKGILDEGSFCDDQLTGEYFGGVLASSRGPISRDDRGASFVALIGRLTSYEIRTHYIFYSLAKALFNASGLSISTPEDRNSMRIFIPLKIYTSAMDFSVEEDLNVIVSHVMFGLRRENLIEEHFQFGPPSYLMKHGVNLTEAGIAFYPSALGAQLFLWAHGMGQTRISEFLTQTIQFEPNDVVTIADGARALPKSD
jgi:hypothetical protein